MSVSSFSHAGLRPVVAIVGCRNAGKSSLLNKITGQDVSIVSDVLGTTTDAVMKAYELIGFGPVSFYDTAGFDDNGKLGDLRVKATEKVLCRADVAILVVGQGGITQEIEEQVAYFRKKKIPFISAFMFKDKRENCAVDDEIKSVYNAVEVSGITGEGIEELKCRLVALLKEVCCDGYVVYDLIKPKDLIMLVTPIDLAAPKGKLIMPQMQVLREILDANGLVVVVKETEVKDMLLSLAKKPDWVIVDSQVVKKMAEVIPQDIRLTTFSTLFARYKGDFSLLSDGVLMIDELKNGDKVLIAEGCSHHITCDDIGRVKIPALMQKYTKVKLNFDFVAGLDFPDNLADYKLVVHCGGCVLNRMEVRRRLNECARLGVKVTNYGIAISYMNGVLKRISEGLI